MVRIEEEKEVECTQDKEIHAEKGVDRWETASEDEHFEDALTEDQQLQKIMQQAEAAKTTGNAAYMEERYTDALQAYENALELLSENTDANSIRAICLCNRAMCYLQMGEFKKAVDESSKAIELNPTYPKAFLRRAQAHEKADHIEESLSDMKKVLELDPGNKDAKKVVQRLEPIVAERREKMKEEMLGKLKDLGNSVLGRFGMSLDSFKTVQDPETGSYSVSYQP